MMAISFKFSVIIKAVIFFFTKKLQILTLKKQILNLWNKFWPLKPKFGQNLDKFYIVNQIFTQENQIMINFELKNQNLDKFYLVNQFFYVKKLNFNFKKPNFDQFWPLEPENSTKNCPSDSTMCLNIKT